MEKKHKARSGKGCAAPEKIRKTPSRNKHPKGKEIIRGV